MIDLSMLTASEIAMLDENKTVLTDGSTDVALYMRFSSDRQTEQSIEGQLRDAIAFCKLRDYRIVAVYVDRAASAKDTDRRVSFLQMIEDSEKRYFAYVIVWKLDRFARNRSDSAKYKMKLKQNGVRVVSVTENISDNPEGIILESVLEGMAEFYSAELSQKITRGRRESAIKCQSVGGHIPLGYKIVDHKYAVDPLTADIVRTAFDLYASGWKVADICREFNLRGYKTSTGAKFNANSFTKMFRNKRYIGVYCYNGTEREDAIPAIIDKGVFAEVQRRLKKTADAPARGKAKVDYILSGKLYCGHCGQPMNGDSGIGRSGAAYHYYTCHGKKRLHVCNKKSIKKEVIEEWVVRDAYELLSPEIIEELADIAVAQSKADLNTHTQVPALKQRQKEVQTSISNILVAIEKGVASETLMRRITELEQENKTLDRRITDESREFVKLDREMVIFWLEQFKEGDVEDESFRRQLIDLFVNRVTMWDTPDGDFNLTITYNLTSHAPTTLSISDLTSDAPPLNAYPNIYVVGLICVQTKRHSTR